MCGKGSRYGGGSGFVFGLDIRVRNIWKREDNGIVRV